MQKLKVEIGINYIKGVNIMKIITILFLTALFVGYIAIASAGGGKEQMQNPVFDEDGNLIGFVVPAVNCEKFFSEQSGASVFFCADEEDND